MAANFCEQLSYATPFCALPEATTHCSRVRNGFVAIMCAAVLVQYMVVYLEFPSVYTHSCP